MDIKIKNAYENNLKNVDVNLPLGAVIGVAGVSGSGKSTLVKNILAEYGMQNYALSLSVFERRFLTNNSVICVGNVEGLPSTLMIDVVNSVNTPSSTLSTITGLHTLLRELYSRYGKYRCPNCGSEIVKDIYEVLQTIEHSDFAELKCDAGYNEKMALIKKNFTVIRTEFYNSEDELQQKKTPNGYARIYLKTESSSPKSASRLLKKCANSSMRFRLSDTKAIADSQVNTICECCHFVLPQKSMALFSFNVPAANGGGACSCCCGTGRVITCNEQKLVNGAKPMNKGGIPVITDKGIQYTTVTEKFLEAVAQYFGFSWSDSFGDLDPQLQDIILNGSPEIINYTDRRGGNNGKKAEPFLGFANYVTGSYKAGKGIGTLADYVADTLCPECKGNRLNATTNAVTYNGVTIDQLLSLNLNELGKTVSSWETSGSSGEKALIQRIAAKVRLYEEVGCDYLELNRQSSTLSGGELQRLRLCTFLSSKITNSCILLDEPSTGLHQKDIDRIISLIFKFKQMGHTVIVIEHNRQILSSCDYLLELGPFGGLNGGEVQYSNWISLKEDISSLHAFGKIDDALPRLSRPKSQNSPVIRMNDFSALYINHQSVELPTNSLITVCGVSGSGKSTFVNYCLIPFLRNNTEELKINRIENLGQKNAAKTSMSNVGSLLGINEKIADLFKAQSGIDRRNFMINSAEGKCPMCMGKGKIVIDDNFEEVCPNCEGRMFNDETLSVEFVGKDILKFLKTPISQLIDIVEDSKLVRIFRLCEQIGVGYLSLLRTSKTLSKGELQRIKLVNVLSKMETGNVYILDEPSKGLHSSDIARLLGILEEIIQSGNTVIAVEHNPDFISACDYAVEFGPSSGKNGGKVVFSGSVAELCASDTATGQMLRRNSTHEDTPSYKSEVLPETGNIKILKNVVIKCNKINHTDILPEDFHKAFDYTNKEYLTAALPACSFFVSSPDDDAENTEIMLPVIRPAFMTNPSFGRKARIVDILNLNADISRFFFPLTRESKSSDHINSEVFSPGSSIGKCPVCKGCGELEQFDFELAFTDGRITPQVEQLLKKRTNYTVAKKYLKSEYGLDIFTQREKLSAEEQQVLLFGDRNRKFCEKGKEYYWEGLNRLVIKEVRYLDDEILAEQIRESKKVSPCIACHGQLLSNKYRGTSSAKITYGELMTISFDRLNKVLDKDAYRELAFATECLVELGFGKYSFFTKMSEIEKKDQIVIQLISYFLHPIMDSVIAIDSEVIENLNSTIQKYLQRAALYCTIVVNTNRKENANERDW